MSVRSSASSRAFQRFFPLLVAIVLSSTTGSRAQSRSTNIEVSSAVQQSSVSRIGVTLSGVELEDAFQRQSKSRGLNPAVFREELVGALKELHPGTIRMEFPDLSQQLAGKFSVSGAAVSGKSVSGSGYGLGEFLQLCAEAGSDPWLRIPSGTTPGEMRELVEYLSGTGSDAWSAARIGSGQSEPWTEVFGKIHIELGNESSSGVAASERMEAGVYAERANADYGAARQTAGFDGSRFDLMLSGAGVSAEWAAAVLGQSRQQDSVAIAVDLPWRGAGTSQAELYGALLAEPEAMDSTGGVVSREMAGLAGASSAAPRGTNVNVGRSQLSLAVEGSEQLAQSWGAGLAQAEHLMQMMAMGARYQNGAVLTENSLHCVGGSQAGNCRSWQFLAEALANGVIGGTMLQTVQTGANPSWSQILNGETVQAHALQSFAFAEGGKVSLVVFNLSRTAELPVTFSGRNAPAGGVQMTQIAPREITDSNESGAELQPSTQTLSASDLSGRLSLPPFSMTLLRWSSGGAAQTSSNPTPAGATHAAPVRTPQAAPKLTRAVQALTTTSSDSSQIDYSGGFAASQGQVILNGNTQLNGSALQLTNGGSGQGSTAWFVTPVNIQSFTTNFTFQLSNPVADGMTFAIQNQGTAALGDGGGGLGYLHIPTSVAVKFDLYNNAGEGADSTGLYTDGEAPMMPAIDLTPSGVDLHSGDTMAVQLTYDGTNLAMIITDTVTQATFSTSWAIDIPATVGGNTAYVGFTAATGSLTSTQNILTWTYTPGSVASVLPTPTFSPTSGTYATAQTVTIVTSTRGETVYYTTDGTTPTTSSAKYTAAIVVNGTETLKAIGTAPGFTDSATATATYTIGTAAPVINFANGFSGSGGRMELNGSAQLSGPGLLLTDPVQSREGAAWYAAPVNVQAFTTDFTFQLTSPSADGMTFAIQNQSTGALGDSGGGLGYQGIPTSVAVKFDLYNNAGEGTDSTGLFADGALPTVPATDMTSSGVNLHSGDIMHVHLTYDGTTLTMTITDTVTNASFSTSFAIDIPATVGSNTAYVGFTGGTGGETASQEILTWTYTPNTVVATPTFSVAAGTYATSQTISISDATSGATIYYTTNGTTPTTSSTKYTGTAIAVSTTETLEAIAVAAGYTNSAVATAAYTIDSVLPMPTFSLPAGTYADSAVTISDSSSSATIYYTMNGTTPTTSSTKYTTPLVLNSSGTFTLNAIAVASGFTNSAMATAVYTIHPTLPTPTFSVAAGTYTSAQTVGISEVTSGATVYYTTDGTTPTTSSTKYTGTAITVSSTENLKAIAVATGYTDSAIASAVYTIASTPPDPSQTIINCPSGFTSTGTCGAAVGENFNFANGYSSLSGSQILLLPTGETHIVTAVNYFTPVGVKGFTTTFTFVPNGQNLAFVLQNTLPSLASGTGKNFDSGAGCEAGFFQSSVIPDFATNIFAMEFDSYSPLTQNGSFTGSSVQVYQTVQSPCNPSTAETDYWSTTKFATSPVALNSPANAQNTTTGDTYSATITYDGSTVTLNLFDVTAGASCPGATCFTKTWSNVSIPSLVNGTTAYVGITTASGLPSSYPLLIGSFSYSTVTPTASPGSTATVGGAATAANPTLSPAPGTYTGTQKVTITCPTPASYAVYKLAPAGQTIMPLPDNFGGAAPAASGILYTGPVAVSSSNTLYAVCGMNTSNPATITAFLPSGVVQGAYTISTGP